MEFDLSTGKTVDFNLGFIGIGSSLDLCKPSRAKLNAR